MAQDNSTMLFRFLAEPGDVNFSGKVHGGTVMKWIDQAGYACAVRWSSSYCVTASISGIDFLGPIKIGSLVTVAAKIVATGRSSLRLMVSVHTGELGATTEQPAAQCLMVFVALDEQGKPTRVPPFVPATPEEARLAELSARMVQLSQQHCAEMRNG